MDTRGGLIGNGKNRLNGASAANQKDENGPEGPRHTSIRLFEAVQMSLPTGGRYLFDIQCLFRGLRSFSNRPIPQ